jgi:2-hydroxy-3-oxopropionate reductase
VLATKADVDPEKVFKAVRGGLAGSTVLDAKAPLALAGNFKPGFRIDLHIKDLQNALDTAQSVDTPTPISQSGIEMMRSLSSDGNGSDDHGGLIQWYEKLAKIEVRK